MERFIVFIKDEIFLIDADELGIYASEFPNAVFGQVVGDQVFGYDIKCKGLMGKAQDYLARLPLVQNDLSEIEF